MQFDWVLHSFKYSEGSERNVIIIPGRREQTNFIHTMQ